MTVVPVRSKRVPQDSRRRSKINTTLRNRGTPNTNVPAGPVIEHVNRLVDSGLTAIHIADLAGLGYDTVYKIIDGQRETVHRRTAACLFSVNPRDLPSHPALWVSAVGSKRRIEALMREGHRQCDLEAALGLAVSRLRQVREHERLRAERAASIAELYKRLANVPGTSAVTARRAKARGWPAPMDWESGDIDDPNFFPDMSLEQKELPAAAKRVLGVQMLGEGVGRQVIADSLGVSRRSVDRWAVQ